MKHKAIVTLFLMFLPVMSAFSAAGEPQASATDPQVTRVQAADDARALAMKSADREKLSAILSGDLRYAHSTGAVDSKASFTDMLASGKTKYVGYDYEERNFTFPAPGIALMTGRVHIRVTTADGNVDGVFSFLAVWREEGGQWKFLAWQSCKLPAAAPKP